MNVIGVEPHSRCVFRTERRAGVWSVTKDHVFYGDYLSRAQAVRSACAAARAMEALGATAQVRAAPDETVIAHQDPHPRP